VGRKPPHMACPFQAEKPKVAVVYKKRKQLNTETHTILFIKFGQP
jgi:hypothetical protein